MIMGIDSSQAMFLLFSLQIISWAHPASSVSGSRFKNQGTIHLNKFALKDSLGPNLRHNISDDSHVKIKIFDSVLDDDYSEFDSDRKLIKKIMKWANEELDETGLEASSIDEDIFKIFGNDDTDIKPVRTKERFQEETQRKSEIQEELVPPDNSCDSLCDYAPAYPENTMREAYLKKQYIYDKSYTPVEFSDSILPANAEADISNRNEFGSSRTLCNSEIFDMFPRIGRNKAGNLRYILNLSEHKQSVQQEICTAPGNNCDSVSVASGNWPFYKLVCEQQQVYSKFDALHPIKKEIVEELFLVKNGCCCRLE